MLRLFFHFLEKVIVELLLRRTKGCSLLRAFEFPGVPYFTGFLTNVSAHIFFQYTQLILVYDKYSPRLNLDHVHTNESIIIANNKNPAKRTSSLS